MDRFSATLNKTATIIELMNGHRMILTVRYIYVRMQPTVRQIYRIRYKNPTMRVPVSVQRRVLSQRLLEAKIQAL